ncbi:MATE family efflux transporter [Pedobacter sp. PAMC26386]|nr:MATE family efflux transporter [Pedobacter sp. PAMC26386]
MKTFLLRTRSILLLLKQAVQGTEKKFTTGGINRAIVLLSVPMVLELAMESLFVFVNIYFVSKLGAGAILIVGITQSITAVAYSVAMGLSIAASTIIARRIGEAKFESAGSAAIQAIYVGVTIGAAIGISLFVFSKEIMHAVGASKEMAIQGDVFSKMMLGSVFLLILRMLLNGIFRGAGDAAMAMRNLWVANLINIVLCPILIFGWGFIPALGLTGAALATLIARVIGVIYQFWYLIQGRAILIIGRAQFAFVPATVKSILRLGFAGTFQYLIPSSSWLVMTKIITHFGADAFAGYIIAQRVASVATMPAWGIGNAAGVLTGQNMGANQPERAEQTVWRAGTFNMCFLCLVALFWLFFARDVIGIFTSVPGILDSGVLYIRYLSIAYILLGYTMVISRALNAAGNVRQLTWLYVLMFYITQLPLAWFLGITMDWGTQGVFVAILTSELVLATACIIIFKKGDWKKTKV